MRVLYVPAGTFPMGSTGAEVDAAMDLCRQHYSICNRGYYGSESPQHDVTLDGFWIDGTEVTNAQYRRCVEAEVCAAPASCRKGEPTYRDASKSDHPVVCVDWDDATAYCEFVGARLPTEAEWEYAARGEAGSIYPWGDDFDGQRLNYCDVNCEKDHADEAYDDGFARTAPVGVYPQGASWCGALDMAGNAFEWVADWLGGYPAEPETNPAGSESGTKRVLRGSSWFYHPARARGAARDSAAPGTRSDSLGFRCAASDGPAGSVMPDSQPVAPGTAAPERSLGDTWILPGQGSVMVYVPGGTFPMGSEASEPGATRSEFPQHDVTLDGFWIGRTEVTNAHYAACVEVGACVLSRNAGHPAYGGDELPVSGVTWQNAADFCVWIGGRTPTEAEWEYAARGPEGNRYPWGDEFDGTRVNYCDTPCSERWADESVDDGYAESALVGSYPEGASWAGALDMAGNVWEWVGDWYGDYAAEAQNNPTGPESGRRRMIRGGCWADDEGGVRAAYRIVEGGDVMPDARHPNIGFRCVIPGSK
jgi:formylglycine-generating enzyme required for sulfatase activity